MLFFWLLGVFRSRDFANRIVLIDTSTRTHYSLTVALHIMWPFPPSIASATKHGDRKRMFHHSPYQAHGSVDHNKVSLRYTVQVQYRYRIVEYASCGVNVLSALVERPSSIFDESPPIFPIKNSSSTIILELYKYCRAL